MTSSDDPLENSSLLAEMLVQATAAQLVCTPEVTNCVSQSRGHQKSVLHEEGTDPVLGAARRIAGERKAWLSLGSLALKCDDPHGRFANRSFLIDRSGGIAARYDKIHMFDVTVSAEETYRESAGYRPGGKAVVTAMGDVGIGLTICYDLRFPHLYRALAKAGADILLVPSAFSPVTGKAHWETLLRARAIETGCFVVAAAQTGTHKAREGAARKTYGHSLIVSPWGDVLLDAGTDPGVHTVDLDLSEVSEARRRIPALQHDRKIEGPDG